MAKNIGNHTQAARALMERAEIMAVVRGAKKTGNTRCEINILQNRKVGEVMENPCKNCGERKWYAKKFDIHLWGDDCPYVCPIFDKYKDWQKQQEERQEGR